MRTSTRSLFHYTNFQNLLGIIDTGFRYHVCEEELPFLPPKGSMFSALPRGVFRYEQHVASVCFCDLPFDRVEDHRKQYGQCCLGMSEQWAMKNGITPVRYIHHGSPDIRDEVYKFLTQLAPRQCAKHGGNMTDVLAACLKDKDAEFDCSTYQKWREESPTEGKKILDFVDVCFSDFVQFLLYSMGLLRVYSGTWRDRVTQQEVPREFYNEREWRALQPYPGKEYLTFEIADVNHVIVVTEQEKYSVVDRLKMKFGCVRQEDIERRVSCHGEIRPETMDQI